LAEGTQAHGPAAVHPSSCNHFATFSANEAKFRKRSQLRKRSENNVCRLNVTNRAAWAPQRQILLNRFYPHTLCDQDGGDHRRREQDGFEADRLAVRVWSVQDAMNRSSQVIEAARRRAQTVT
jgi:hypothetical protein